MDTTLVVVRVVVNPWARRGFSTRFSRAEWPKHRDRIVPAKPICLRGQLWYAPAYRSVGPSRVTAIWRALEVLLAHIWLQRVIRAVDCCFDNASQTRFPTMHFRLQETSDTSSYLPFDAVLTNFPAADNTSGSLGT